MNYEAGVFWLGVLGAASTLIVVVFTVGRMTATIVQRLDELDTRMDKLETAIGIAVPGSRRTR